jgi:membrane protease YdiL (CAAX protease family)
VTIFFPISGYLKVKNLKKRIAEGENHRKIKFFYSTIFWSWIPIFLIFIMMPISGVSFESIGIKWINIDTSSVSKWILFPAIGFYFFFLFYNIYSIIIFKYNEERRAKAAMGIPNDFNSFLPTTQNERGIWDLVSVSAGISEEILYRGYFFFALAVVFPNLSISHILLISTILFGIGHIYLGKELIKATLLGLMFGIFYIVFDSVIPVIIFHITQDLVLRDILKEEI